MSRLSQGAATPACAAAELALPERCRIALVTPNVAVDGGVASHVVASARALRAHGTEVTILAGDDADIGFRVVQVDGLTETGTGDRSSADFEAALASVTPTLVHFHNVDDARAVTVARRNAAVVVSAHGYSGCGPNTYFFRAGHECTRAHGPGCLPNMLFRGCAQTRSPLNIFPAYGRAPRRLAGLHLADATVAYSSAVAEHLRRNAVPRIHVVPLATPHVEASPDPGESSILFVGRVTPVKGISPLLEALARIEGRLEICGTGWGIAAARSETKRLGLQGRVTFAGWVAPQELDAAYRRARIVVVPSLWPEPFGLVGIEAMAHRRPVIGSATGGIPDWLVDGQTGLLVSPGDVPGLAAAMSALLQDPALCARMGLAGQAHAMAQFSEAAHVQALRSTYAAALDHRRQSGDSD